MKYVASGESVCHILATEDVRSPRQSNHRRIFVSLQHATDQFALKDLTDILPWG